MKAQYRLLKDTLYEISFNSVSGYKSNPPIFFTLKSGSVCEYFKHGDCFNFHQNKHEGFIPHFDRETVTDNPEWFEKVEVTEEVLNKKGD